MWQDEEKRLVIWCDSTVKLVQLSHSALTAGGVGTLEGHIYREIPNKVLSIIRTLLCHLGHPFFQALHVKVIVQYIYSMAKTVEAEYNIKLQWLINCDTHVLNYIITIICT